MRKILCSGMMILIMSAGVVLAADWPMFRQNPAHTGTYAQPAALAWSFPTLKEIVSSPTVNEGLVFFGAYDKRVYALDAKTGEKKWEFVTGDKVKSSPAVSGEQLA